MAPELRSRNINNVGDCRNENRNTRFDKPDGNRIRITHRTAEENVWKPQTYRRYKSNEVRTF